MAICKWKSSSSDFCLYILILVSVVMFAIGIFNNISLNYKEKHCTQEMSVKIVRVEKDTRTSGRIAKTVYTPYFIYSLDGKIFNGHAKYTTNSCKYKKGDIIEIKIDPENPERYLVENDISDYHYSYKSGMTFGFLALILIVCAIGKKLI